MLVDCDRQQGDQRLGPAGGALGDRGAGPRAPEGVLRRAVQLEDRRRLHHADPARAGRARARPGWAPAPERSQRRDPVRTGARPADVDRQGRELGCHRRGGALRRPRRAHACGRPRPRGEPTTTAGFPPGFFDRVDDGDDAVFYAPPRLVTHIDDDAIAAVGELYEELGISGDVLDLMSSWVSHFRLPPRKLRVLGMNTV